MTDNEIIKALEIHIKLAEYVDSSYCDCIEIGIIKKLLTSSTDRKQRLRTLNTTLNV